MQRTKVLNAARTKQFIVKTQYSLEAKNILTVLKNMFTVTRRNEKFQLCDRPCAEEILNSAIEEIRISTYYGHIVIKPLA